VRTALLEADVNLPVVKEFMDRVGERAVGQQLIKSVRPEQQIVKIVHDELVELMGPVDASIRFEKAGPTVVMLCGLRARARRPPAASSRGCWRRTAASRSWSPPTFSARRPSSSSRSSASSSRCRCTARQARTR
jgi:hypothetical protein